LKEEVRMTKVVLVKFSGTPYKEYAFRTDLDLEKGDKVVCDCSTGLSIATVTACQEINEKATRWIIQKIDLTEHQKRVDREKALEKLEKEMAKRARELTNISQYQILAQGDMVMAGLLSRYNYLANGGEANVSNQQR
jgi:hypothetical protein